MQNLSLVYFRYPRLASLVCDFFSLALYPRHRLLYRGKCRNLYIRQAHVAHRLRNELSQYLY